jgi:hypothetical protein
MGKIGYGYGSEWHLLRYLGCHRNYLSEKVKVATGSQSVNWMDSPFSKTNIPLKQDREFEALEFVSETFVQSAWNSFWPQTGSAQNWDAVAMVTIDNQPEWLLVEAKSYPGEMRSTCGAKESSRQKIFSALEQTSIAVGNHVQAIDHWLSPYYQYANRLAALHFLTNVCKPAIKARLLFVYFCSDSHKRVKCPKSEQEWLPDLQKISNHLGIDKDNALMQRVHRLFLPVNPEAIAV